MQNDALFQLLADRVEGTAKLNEAIGDPRYGITEVIDESGRSLFFDEQESRLIRCFGPYRLSPIEMKVLQLEPTRLSFRGGYFLRKIKKS